MNLMDTLNPSFKPDLTKAKRVTFKSPQDQKDDELAKLEKEEIQRQLKANAHYRVKLSRWRKEKEKAQKRVTRCEWFLNEAQKALKGVEDAKPLPPVSGSESKPVLEPLYVVTQEEIPQFVQSNN